MRRREHIQNARVIYWAMRHECPFPEVAARAKKLSLTCLENKKKTFYARSVLRNKIAINELTLKWIRGSYNKADNALLTNAFKGRECGIDKMDN